MNDRYYMYVSQWALKVGAPGMSLYEFNAADGTVRFLKTLDDSRSFGCSVIDEKQNVLYVVNECDLFPETPMNTGRVYAYRIDRETGDLTELNHKETFCPFTSYVNLDPTGKYLVTSNHSWPTFVTSAERGDDGVIRPVVRHNDSLVNLFRVNDDGSIGDMIDIAKHPASEEIVLSLLGRPHIPHPHCMMRSPSGRLFACCDKGDGHMYIYSIENERLVLKSRTLTDTEHSEPRYCAFHPTKPYLFVNHEHTPGDKITMTAFRYDEEGNLTKIGSFYGDVTGFEPKEDPRQQQGMCISPDGSTVYTQVHGYDLILVWHIGENGEMSQIQAVPIDGVWPRALGMSPDGRYLINCCLAGTISVYAVNPDGTLTDTGHRAGNRGSAYVSFCRK